jgi:hypothetical protein
MNSPAFLGGDEGILMTRLTMFLAAGAATVAAAIPAAAQTPYQYPQPGYAYPQQGYAYPQQGYAYPNQPQGSVSQIVNQLLGNRYATNDRTAVERCATAAMAQASAQYRPNNYRQGYGYQNQPNGYGNQGYYPAQMRVTAITDVRRRSNGVRVSGLLDSSGGAYPPYGNAYGYQGQGYQNNQAYAGQGDLTFRCNVDYRGAVSNVRINRNKSAYNDRRGY